MKIYSQLVDMNKIVIFMKVKEKIYDINKTCNEIDSSFIKIIKSTRQYITIYLFDLYN